MPFKKLNLKFFGTGRTVSQGEFEHGESEEYPIGVKKYHKNCVPGLLSNSFKPITTAGSKASVQTVVETNTPAISKENYSS